MTTGEMIYTVEQLTELFKAQETQKRPMKSALHPDGMKSRLQVCGADIKQRAKTRQLKPSLLRTDMKNVGTQRPSAFMEIFTMLLSLSLC